jgi:hypothetical protein
MVKKIIRILEKLLVGWILLHVGGGCTASEITFEELVTHPDKYKGKEVCLEGYYIGQLEYSYLIKNKEEKYKGKPKVDPWKDTIWVEGLQREEIGCSSDWGKPCEVQVVICGEFQFGERYGIFNSFKYQLTKIKNVSKK